MEQDSAQGGGTASLPYDIEGIALLYVEDESDAREMVGRMLAMNYPKLTLHTAENGAVGLELYRRLLPDIVMTDINMPVMDGIRMSREIKSLNTEANIIAVTAHSDTAYLLNAIEIGIHHYVLKPINYEELFAVLDKILEQLVLRRLFGDQNRRIAQSERQLSGAQRIAHLGSWQLFLGDGTMNWSDEMYRICGFEPGSIPASYQGFLGRFLPEDLPAVQKALEDAVRDRQPVGSHFCRVSRPDGSQRIVRLEAELTMDDSGAPATLLGTAHDVTELKLAEEKIRTLTEELEQRVIQRTSLLQASVRELESFSYFVSHDLRAPVARLEGFCRALIEDCNNCDDSGCAVYAERAERVVRQIKQIIDAFNNLTHFVKCKLVIVGVDLSGLARQIAEALRLSEPGRRVDFAIAEGLLVKGDARLMQIALEQLLKNAWKFTSKKESGRIEFGSSEVDGARVFFVRDNGAGFNMKYLGKLFKPFQTVHSPGEYSWDGTAIGLATVHSIILRHGGRIWAEGEPGKGATFYFTLKENPEPGTFLEEA
jgi:PAS domain S-box-containing protein